MKRARRGGLTMMLILTLCLLCGCGGLTYTYPTARATPTPEQNAFNDPLYDDPLVLSLLQKADIVSLERYLSLLGDGWHFARTITDVELAVSALDILNRLTGMSMYSRQQVSSIAFHIYGKKIDHDEVAESLNMQPSNYYRYNAEEEMYYNLENQDLAQYGYYVLKQDTSQNRPTVWGEAWREEATGRRTERYLFRATFKQNSKSILGYNLIAFNDMPAESRSGEIDWSLLHEYSNPWQGLFFAVNDEPVAGLDDLLVVKKVGYGCGREEAEWVLGKLHLTDVSPTAGKVQREVWYYENMTEKALTALDDSASGLALVFERKNDIVILTQAYITSPTYKTARGLTVGMAASELLGKYRNEESAKGISEHWMYGKTQQAYGMAHREPDGVRVKFVLEEGAILEYKIADGVIKSIYWRR